MKKAVGCMLSLLLLFFLFASAPAEEARTLENMRSDILLPEEAPTYHLIYDYPHLVGEDAVAVLINDSFASARDEMTGLMLPMLANLNASESGFLRVLRQEYRVMCNNGRLLSVLFMQSNEMENGTIYSLEGHTFDVSGEYAGQVLTLRGIVMVGESTDEIVSCLLPELYKEFVRLQNDGVILPDLTEDDFYDTVFPESDFYANDDGSVTFFFQPEIMVVPSFEVPCFTYTPDMLQALIREN